MANKLPLSASTLFESIYEEDHHQFLTLFDNHLKGKRICELPLCLTDEIEKGESPWPELRFESKTQTNQLFNAWRLKVVALPGNVPGWCEAISYSRLLLLTRHHHNLELLVSRWSCNLQEPYLLWLCGKSSPQP